jgi:sugar lactone lactonase YvrE
VNRFLIHALEPDGASVRTWLFNEPVVALALTEEPGRLLVALGSKLIFWNAADDSRVDQGFALAEAPGARLNDGRAGPEGAFWVGSMGNNVGPNGEALEVPPGRGVLMRIGVDGAVTRHKSGLGISNTVCWSPDGTRFYFGDTLANTIWVYDYDGATGTIGGERPFFAGFERGVPDGSVVDAEGFLWNCRFGGSCVVRVSPDGEIDRVVEMPVRNATTCAFGGPALDTLYITSSSILTRESDRLAGSLFALRGAGTGLPSYVARI